MTVTLRETVTRGDNSPSLKVFPRIKVILMFRKGRKQGLSNLRTIQTSHLKSVMTRGSTRVGSMITQARQSSGAEVYITG